MVKKPSRKTLSFAEAEGKIRFPLVLEWGALDQRVRAALWNALFPFFNGHVAGGVLESSYYTPPLGGILRREYVQRRHGFVSDFPDHYPNRKFCLDDWSAVFRQWEYVELFDFLTFFLRDKDCPKELIVSVANALDEPWCPYRLISKPPTVVPAISKPQATVIKRDVEEVFDSSFEGSKAHLQAALDALNKGNHRDVVRESIHAVESAARDFTHDPNAMLSTALKRLTNQAATHRALSDAFEKLYAYSSDEKGIRHSLVLGENEKVGFDEALFFVSACSAFVAFLSRKAEAKNKQKSAR
jgi:hypothetical protein